MQNRMRRGLLLVLALMMCVVSFLQDLRNSSSILIGRIESDGIVCGRSNIMIGKIGSDGTIVNRNYMTVGR